MALDPCENELMIFSSALYLRADTYSQEQMERVWQDKVLSITSDMRVAFTASRTCQNISSTPIGTFMKSP